MANFPFTVGDSLRIGSATISASGNAVVLPTGTQVGNQNVATTVEVSTGGGPKITNLQVTSNVYVVLDDTAVDLTGGFIKITGTNFVSGCMVYVASTPANSTTFVSTTEVRAQLPATAAGTYPVYLVNPDGGTAIRVPGVTFSASPAWQTGSSLGEQYDGVVLTLPVVATDATVYTLSSGSLPPGLSLNSNTGVISGTVSGVANDTVYSFTITATDAQLQDSPRTFTVTITVSDPYFRLTTLLLSGSAISANTVIRDSSTNNFNLTVAGDARASNFTPYGTGWSVYFDGTGDYLQVPYSTANDLGTGGNWTVELWVYMPSIPGDAMDIIGASNGGGNVPKWHISINMNSSFTYTANLVGFFTYIGGANRWLTVAYTWTAGTWYHIAATYDSTNTTLYVNGQSVGSQAYNAASSSSGIRIGSDGEAYKYFTGYISNCRVVKGTALYTANFTPATTNLTAVANTSLLTCNANRFLDGSTNNFAITRNGDARVVSFNPFNITNTSVNGSAYFDGTGDYLSTSNPAFAVGTGAFTIEAWVYPFNVSSKIVGSLASSVDPAGDRGIGFYTDGARIGRSVTAQFDDISTSIMPVAYQWNHIVLVRENTSTNGVKFYVNGLLGGQGTSAISVNKQQVVVGRQYPSEDASYFSGYISSVRWTNAAVYTGAFTPPTQPLTAIANTQLLTLQYDQPHNNHTFLDSSSNQFLITRSGNATQGAFSPFSQTGWGNYFNGSSYLSATGNAATQMGTGAFTWECWCYILGTSSYQGFIDTRTSPSSGSTTGMGLFLSTGTLTPIVTTTNTILTSSINVTANSWNHVALTRSSGGTLTIWVNGSSGGTISNSSNLTDTSIWVGGNSSSPYPAYVNGYLSNVRMTKGADLYTTPFTPPTSPLTTTVSSGTVSLLTCQSNRFRDASTNNFTITANGSPTVVAFSPFAATAVYNPVAHGGSAYFDGSGDYARIGSDITPLSFLNTAGAVATIEAWVYATSLRAGSQSYTHPCILGIGSTYMNFGVANGTPRFYWWNGAAGTTLDSSITITANTWNHIALVFSGTGSNNYKIFVNGTLGGTGTFTNIGWASASGGNNVLVGREEANPATSDWPGYISGLRIINGSALYNSSFTPATTPFTSTANTICLLNFTDAAILDSTGRNVFETVADAKTSSVITKFTGGSMYFDGTGDYLQSSAPLSELVFLHNGTPWTVEGWFYTGSTSAQYILSTDAASASIGMSIGLSDTNTRDIMAQIFRGVSGSWLLAISPTNSWSLNTWTHFAATFDSSKNLTVYINGVQVATASGSSFAFSSANPSYPLVVGRYQSPTPGGYFNGYISDLRVTRGYARYTGNFPTPTAPARLK